MKRLCSMIALAAGVALVACATIPKPQELLDLEVMRDAEEYQDAHEMQPDLAQESDEAHAKSLSAWEEDELDLAKHWALMGTIKLRMALSLMGQEAARQRLVATKKELAAVSARRADLAAKIKETDEQLDLVNQLAAARKQHRAELTEVQKREEAQKKVGEAQLALRMADTVDAKTHARNDYATAQSLLAKAQAGLKSNNTSDAIATAQVAKSKADSAYHAARPKFQAVKKDAQRKVTNQALQRDAAAIPGVTLKMKTVGDTQQLLLPVVDIARGRGATLRPRKIATLNAIGALLKKYPAYPVLVNGYTSHRVRGSNRYSVSHARAQAVASHLITMGVDVKRMAISGFGAEHRIGRKRSRINDRVEVVILFQ